MRRREFLKRTGLSISLLSVAGITELGAKVNGRKILLPAQPRPEDWIEKERLRMYPLLSNGYRRNWITGFTIPKQTNGWNMMEIVPLNLKFVEQSRRPIPGTIAFYEDVTYRFTVVNTGNGTVRVDFLDSQIEEMIRMQLFLVELNGRRIGEIGRFIQEPTVLQVNFYRGIQDEDLAYRITSNCDEDPVGYREAQLEIWRKHRPKQLILT